MKQVSKRAARIAQAKQVFDEAQEALLEVTREQHGRRARGASLDDDARRLAQAAAVLAEAEASSDEYTCPQCGADFPDGPHVDFLIAAFVEYGEDGTAIDRLDLGMAGQRVDIAEGRRMKVCGPCVNGWAIKPRDYFEMR